MTSSLFEVHFTRVDQYVEELIADMAAGTVQDGIVRLVVVSGAAPGRLPMSEAQSWFVESSYVSTRQQLVKISLWAGWKWTEPERHKAGHNPGPEHNRSVDNTVRETLLRIQAPLQQVAGIKLRGGSLVESHDIWQPEPGVTITTPDELKCATCSEPIYYANEAWRHKATKRADAVEDLECPACNGSGEDRLGNRGICQRCRGNRVIKGGKVNHVAEPEAVAEGVGQ